MNKETKKHAKVRARSLDGGDGRPHGIISSVVGSRRRAFQSASVFAVLLLLVCAPILRAQAGSIANATAPPKSSSPAVRSRATQMYAALPMSFEANAGQTDPSVKFLAHAPGYSLFLTDQEAVLSLLEPSPVQEPLRAHDPLRHPKMPQPQRAVRAVRVKFLGGNETAAVAGTGELPAKSNYFIGNDPKQWHTNVPNYSAVKYSGIYPGVDAVFHGDNRRLEFDFDIAPGASARSIALEVDGARRMRLNRAGGVVIGMDAAHKLVMNKPHVYQELPAGRREIAGNYLLGARNRIAFALGPYDHTRPLVIDPTLVYSTYLGGGVSQVSFANAIAVDSASLSSAPHGEPIDCSAGCAVVAGSTGATTVFPTTTGSYNPGPAPVAGNFAFIAKFKTDGSGLVYSTYFGGTLNDDGIESEGDQIFAIAVDSTGAAYFGGISETEDTTPTTLGSFMPVRPSLDPVPFVSKLSADGSTLVYSTYLDGNPGSDEDSVNGIAVDSSGSAYVTGITTAASFPTTAGAFQTVFKASTDLGTAFVTKLSADGSSLVYSTLLGGSTGENYAAQIGGTLGEGAIAVDASGDAYVTGFTHSTDFPTTTGAYSTTCASTCEDVFVTKVNATGTALVYSTFLGGTGAGSKDAIGRGIAVDSAGSAFVGGTTNTLIYPVTSGALQTSPSAGFITKLTPDGTGLVYSSYFRGDIMSVAVGADDSAVLFGFSNTTYAFESTPDAFNIPSCPSSGGCFYGFLSKLTADGSGLIFSSPVGADAECCTVAGALDPAGNAYLAGSTSSQDLYTTPGAFETSLPSNYTGFTPYIAKVAFSSSTPLTISPNTLPSGTAGVPYAQTLTATGGADTVTFDVTTGSPPSGVTLASGGTLSGTPTQTGTFPFTVTATDSTNNTGSQAYSLQIVCPSIAVSPATLAAGTSGTTYSAVTFTETGGVGTTNLSETGALPTGMNFMAPVLSGTPTQTGSFPIEVTATDSNSCTGSINPTLTINSAVGQPVQVTDNEIITVSDTETFPDIVDSEPITVTDTVSVTASLIITTTGPLPAGFVGVPYSATFAASGGSGTGYIWSITSGGPALSAAGLSLSTAGVFSGMPSAAGTYPFAVQVADSAGNMYSANFSITVTASAPIANLSTTLLTFAPQASGTASATQTVTLTNTGNGPLSFTGSGITISGANATDFSQTNQCPSSVAAGSNCPINVTFTPISPPSGIVAAELNVADNAGGSPQQVGLSGIVLPSTSVSCTIPPLSLSADSATDQITCAEDLTNPAPLGPVALVCNLPAILSKYITCSFSPSSLDFTSTSTPPYAASTTLTIQPVKSGSASLERKPWPWAVSSGGVAFGAVLWLPAWLFVSRRKKGKSKYGLLLLLILLCGLPMITSCVGKSGPSTPPAGTYQASFVLTGPGLNETLTFTIQEP